MESPLFANHPTNVKTDITNTANYYNAYAQDILPNNTLLLKGDNTLNQLLNAGDEITLDYQIQFTSRGNHTFNGLDIQLSDIYHLYTYQTIQPHTTSVMVHSDPKEIQKAKRVSTREHIELAMPSLIGTETIPEMEGIRDYLPGDRLKDIEWKATSRLQKLMTKLFQKQEVVETVILLDCSRSMRRTTKTQSKIDHATNLAIHLTKILQSLRHPVGMIAYDEFKAIKTVESTNTHQELFEALTELPGQLHTNGYMPKHEIETELVTPENPMARQRFLATVFPFLAEGKRTITHPSQASGIYEALRLLLMTSKNRHLIIITDMETNIHSLYNSIQLAHSRKYKIWLLTSFTPYYNLDKKQLTSEQLEVIYKLNSAREKTLLKLKKMNIDIVELTPSMEGGRIVEKIRRKQT